MNAQAVPQHSTETGWKYNLRLIEHISECVQHTHMLHSLMGKKGHQSHTSSQILFWKEKMIGWKCIDIKMDPFHI